MTTTRIEQIRQTLGQEIWIEGWLYNKRSSGGIQFLQVRDGSGIIQGVVTKKNEKNFLLAERLTQESSIRVKGIAKEDPRSPTGYELSIQEIELVHLAEEYPITPKDHGTGFLMDNRHLWMRSSKQVPVLRIRHEVMQAIRDYFNEHGFIATESPILTGVSVEGTTTLFGVDYFGEKAFLSQSGQLYLEATAMALGRVYWIGPTFRAEQSKTRKHLTEFWMAEAEVAYFDHEDNLRLQEDLVKYIIGRVIQNKLPDLKALDRDISKLEKIIAESFARVTYKQAIDLLNEKGMGKSWGDDFGAPDEEAISDHFKKPVFIEKFPAVMKAFYMEPDPENQELVKAADLIAPEGYGEIIGGSERISNKELLLKKLEEHKLPREPYEWYIDLRKYGSVPHAGFGMGVERTVAWITGVTHLRECIPFPRQLHRLTP
ncbi:asparagine--tRNA ligase [Candidatus Acetothermia bacterium]|nr:asparagine--tRNA ligase [Candidatus Acetothermia bacterium]MBI3642939.1 asparagine--tRNA ligase [Candidatus Acetothermia bacterium]